MRAAERKTLVAFARQIGIQPPSRGSTAPIDEWLRVLLLAKVSARTRTGVSRVIRTGRCIGASLELQAALDTVARLGDASAVARFLAEHAEEKTTEEQAAAKKEAARKAVVERRAAHARAKLAEHEALLAREEKLVDKWRKKVAYYDAKGV